MFLYVLLKFRWYLKDFLNQSLKVITQIMALTSFQVVIIIAVLSSYESCCVQDNKSEKAVGFIKLAGSKVSVICVLL